MPSRQIEVTALPAFTDNYLWMIHDKCNAVAVDPGDAAVVSAWLHSSGLRLTGVLLTHHHPDHIGGVAGLLSAHGPVPVIGHAGDAQRLPPLSQAVIEGDQIVVPGLALQLQVMVTPGHTVGHICYVGAGLLFCGDTLFSAGCGRMFEGTAEQFHASLTRLAALPPATQVFAAHEYTQSNLAFAASVTPDDVELQQAYQDVRSRRARGERTLPSSIGWERRYNPFLRCSDPALAGWAGLRSEEPTAIFAALRRAKDLFRSA